MHDSASKVKHDDAQNCKRIGLQFSYMTTTTRDYLSANMDMLLLFHQWTPKELSRRSNVSPRMIAYILQKEKTPSIDVVEKIGSAFGVKGWLMISPYLDLKTYKNLEKLNQNFASSSDQGKDYILMVAQREAEYSRKAG